MKRMILAAAIGLSMLCWCTALADTWTDENGVVWTYTIKNGVATVGGGSFFSPAIPRETSGDITIPSMLGGCPVTGIDECAFQDCKRIRSLVIPDSVTSIEKSAFAYCIALKIIKFGNGVGAINYGVGSQIVMARESYTIFNNPFVGCSALVGIEFGTGITTVNMNNFSDSTKLRYVFFPASLPRAGYTHGTKSYVVYVTHEAYPGGLPSETWADAPLKFLEGDLPSEGNTWDFEFYKQADWPQPFYLTSETNSTVACTRFFVGDPIYCSYSCIDSWGIADIVGNITNVLRVNSTGSGFNETSCQWKDADGLAAGTSVRWFSRIYDNLQNLAPGEYTATLILNDAGTIPETNYANNTNSITFKVVPATEVTFVSDGNTIATRKYESNAAYETFPANPIRQGFSFIGWFSEEEGGDAITASSKVPLSPTTLYAHWDIQINDVIEVDSSPSSSTKWIMGNLYKVTANISIPSGSTLTIEPGVIVKFAAGKSLTVNNGGTLNAQGTRVLPIIFTSIKDDANGGDTNGDGSDTTAQPGDWCQVKVSGTANFNYTKVLYTSSMENYGGIEAYGGVVNFDNSEIAHTKFECVNAHSSGTFTARNSVFADSSLGFGYYGSNRVRAYNCIFAGLTTAVRQSEKLLVNCIFYECQQFTDQSGDYSTFRNCVFYNPVGYGAQRYVKCGKDGNVWANPLFFDPEIGDFRIAANSPCVDAGDGTVAPTTDYYGSPRMNVDAVRPTGTLAANGAVPDIGIYEVPGDGNIPSADLVVTDVTAPESLTIGENVEVSWTVKNVGEESVTGMWRDEIEIVAANGQGFSMGTSTVQAEIRPGATANFRATVTVPAAPEGTVQVRVTANKYQDIFEAIKSENNVGSAAATLAVPTLAVPTDGTATSVTLGGDSDYGFKVATSATLPSQGGVLLIRSEGELDAWLGDGAIAAKGNAIRTAVQIADGTWLLQIPAGSESRVTVRNDGEASVAAQLSLEVGAFFLLDTGKKSAANSGVVTVPFAGNGFDESVTCWLEKDGVRVDARDVTVESDVSARAMFDMQDREAGDWTLHVKKGTDEASASLLTLTESRIGVKWYGEVDSPDVIRSGRAYVGTFRYGNSGDTATNAPYVRLEAKGSTLIRFSEADAWSKSIELLAASDTYPASVLKAGDSSKVTFFYKTSGAQAEIEYACTFSSVSNVPWAKLEAEMRPAWASDELWGFAFATLRANFGETWNDYLGRMRSDCDHLLKIGSPVKRMDRLMQLEVNDALGNDTALARLASATDLARSGRGLGISFSRSYSSSLRGRFTKGILGYGWTDNFSTYAELQDAQTLVFHLPSGGSYSFTKVTGSWQPEDARDTTTLTETTDAYILTYSSGTVQTFAKSNMKTTSICDNQGNALTFTYSGAQLQKVQHSDGQTLAFTYTNGKLTKVMDDQGRTVTYAYTGDLLTAVTSFNGLVTSYEYLSASGKPTNRALSKIMYSDGSTKEFTYDAKGLVSASSVNGGQLKTEIVRGDFGCYSIVAPNGGVTEVTVGANGETLKTVNARGETVNQTYTADSLLEATIAPSGKRSKISYNKDGSPIASMSASGATTAFSYTPEFNNLASVTDAKDHALTYSYDELGRSTAVNYVDGSSSTLEYNEKGDVMRSTNRRGETIEYEYDAEGNLVKKTWQNGRTFALAYDAKGNVTNAVDSVTGAVTMEYDANERLTRIVYPKGRGFTYTYDAFGRVTERAMLGGTGSVPSASATQRYTYDSLGRLATVTDGNDNPYLTNSYDPATGWLITQTYGNGTVVSNAYDILGRTIGIYHGRARTPAAPLEILAFFEYAYDADGKCISQTTAEGTESYTYDADGQLTAVTYPDGTSETFTYDAVGNRITYTGTTGISPVAYTVNNLNQYTKINDTTLEYDLDGNMTSKGDTRYYYDTLNRLVAVTNETENIRWSCEYDVFGNRVSVTDNGTTTERLFVQGSLPSVAAEYNGETLSKSHILVGAVRLATHNSPTPNSPTLYYHVDLLGSARLLTDDSGATKGTRSFKAFGETRTSTGETTDAGYVGTLGVESDSNGLLFMRNRYYDSSMGRFVQMDPIGLKGRDVNLYRYCANCPILNNDVSGFYYGYNNLSDIGKLQHLGDIREALRDEVSKMENLGITFDVSRGASSAEFNNRSRKIIVNKEISAMNIEELALLVHELQHARDFIECVRNGSWMLPDIDTYESHAYQVQRDFQEAAGGLPSRYSNATGESIWAERRTQQKYLNQRNRWHITQRIPVDEGFRRNVLAAFSNDPNEISGPLGAGAKRYKQQGEWMDYTIYFENKTNATAAAQEVFVDLPMDANLDWSTLELGEIAFGAHIDTSLVGKKLAKKARLKARYPFPGTNTFVNTEVKMKDGVLSWYIRDWDPTTTDNFPASATGGFLPPNDPATHCGEGHLSFRVKVKSDAPNGAVIASSATIVFDSNAPIETDPSWFNTVGTFNDIMLEVDGAATNMVLIVGEPYGELPTPKARAGYTFAGWYTGPNGTGRRVRAQDLVQAGDSKLYAHWLANAYTVHFNANGGSGLMSDQVFEFGKATALDANAFTRQGFAFAGWATNATGVVVYADGAEVRNLTDVNGGVVTLYAMWTPVPTPTPQPEPQTEPQPEPQPEPQSKPTPGRVPAPVAAERLRLCSDVAGAVPVVAALYDGYICDGAGSVKGTIQVKVGKPNAKTGLAAVSAVVVGLDGKKTKLKASDKGKAQIASDGPTTVSLEGGESCTVVLGADGMGGTYGAYEIDGARNVFASKDSADKAAAAAVLGKWKGAVNVAWRADATERVPPYNTLSVSIANKGKVKVAGTLANGTKVSASGQLSVGEEWCCVPVAVSKKGVSLQFAVWLPAATSAAAPVVVGLGDDVKVGKPGTLKGGAAFRIDADAFAARWGQRALPYLPDGVAVGGGAKWTLPKAGSVAYAKGTTTVDETKAGENPSGLKFTYKAKDGTFKGSFKAYSDVNGKPKATKVDVTGVLVDGVGYGAATVKKVGGVAVTVE